jgi:SAM-dependent methyltransferase
MQVVSADLDLKSLERGHVRSSKEFKDRVCSVRVDALAELPFRAEQFDLVLVVHFQLTHVMANLIRLTKPGGLIILETFGAQGENWRDLPRVGEIPKFLASKFSMVHCSESPVRREAERVTLRAIARKKLRDELI